MAKKVCSAARSKTAIMRRTAIRELRFVLAVFSFSGHAPSGSKKIL
ncbi:hypothetical protein [Paenibacillus cookii]|nr:hypothetical protein [Paenibacillus cookii]